ncbi:MAG: cell division protein FtsZ, partial [Candidatus Methanoperedens sp.]|nr:cell division protein FtsZ [Candidatus Methanoperedens sp.]
MESFVQDALKMAEKDKLMKRETSCSAEDMEDFGTPRIVVVGCGGGGNNTVNRLYNLGVAGAETIAINTDKIHLDMIQADKKILV